MSKAADHWRRKASERVSPCDKQFAALHSRHDLTFVRPTSLSITDAHYILSSAQCRPLPFFGSLFSVASSGQLLILIMIRYLISQSERSILLFVSLFLTVHIRYWEKPLLRLAMRSISLLDSDGHEQSEEETSKKKIMASNSI